MGVKLKPGKTTVAEYWEEYWTQRLADSRVPAAAVQPIAQIVFYAGAAAALELLAAVPQKVPEGPAAIARILDEVRQFIAYMESQESVH